ncbi:transporter substrate-binding domain-containing protein [Salinispira pacifica]
MTRVLAVVLGLALAATGAVFAGGGKLVVATDATYKPMEFVNGSGELDGYDIELMRAVGRAADFEISFRNVRWDSIFTTLLAGQCDAVISTITITEDRRKRFEVSIPYLTVDHYLVVRADNQDVKSLQDLAGRRVAALQGSTSITVLENARSRYRYVVVPYSDFTGYVADLVDGRIDAFVAEETVLALNDTPEYRGAFKIVGDPVSTERYGILVRKGNTRVLEMINRGLKMVLQSDEAAAIGRRWLK